MANDLLRSDSMNADAMYVRGLCLYYEDFVDKAFTHFQQVLRLAPDHQRAKATYKVSYLPQFAQCYVVRGLVSMGLMGSAEPTNFEKRVLKPIIF